MRIRALASAVAIALSGMVARSEAQPAVTTEYRLKAAFLHQFPQFVEWPDQAWAASERVEICVLRPNPFGSELDLLVRGETLRGRPLAIRQLDAADPITTCHVLFLAARRDAATLGLLKQAAMRPILTVGDAESFLDDGGIILLKMVDRRVRFEINVANAQRVGLRISSQLLNLAQAVRGRS
jgi:hypothetical protein